MKYWKYLKYLLKHKYYMFLGGLKYKVPLWILIFHDYDKFYPYMFKAFAKNYYGDKLEKENNIFNYLSAWNDHQKRNKSHFEYWICLNPYNFADGNEIYLEIPEVYIREMLADWFSAGVCKRGILHEEINWYEKHKKEIKLNKKTREKLERILENNEQVS